MSRIKDLYAEVNGIDDLKPVDDIEVAHQAWLIKKETIINKLEMLIQDTPSEAYKDTLREAIKFINEGEV